MNRKNITGDRRRRKLITTLWAIGLTALVITLIYLEQTAVLYILCTLGVTVLLLIVGLSDLGHADTKAQEVVQPGDAARAADR